MTLNDIIASFKSNKQILEEASKLDNSDFKFNFNKAIDILNRFREFKAAFLDKKSLVVTNGNPYITIILCMQAISQNISLTINIQDTMFALNSAIVKVFDLHLNEEGPQITKYMSPREFINASADDIVVIDDRTKFYFLRDELNLKVRYVSLLNVDLYTDSSELLSLTDTIYDYCNQTYIGVDVHTNESLDEFVNEANRYESGNVALILTKEKVNQMDINDKLSDKKVYYNCNPFAKIEVDVALKNILK